jgi:outer membrane immunogenic protein
MKRAIQLGIGALALATLSLPAAAADLGARPIGKAPVVAPVALYNWSGFYIGGHIGGVWGDKDWTDVTLVPLGGPAIPDGGHEVSGFLAGGQIGFNWQAGAWVFGLEGQVSWTNADGSHPCLAVLGVFLETCTTELSWLGSAAGRVGYAFNNVLVYAKGGFAFANEEYFQNCLVLCAVVGNIDGATGDDTRTGWMVGAGLEYGFTPNWSFKVEYNYMDFGNETYNLINPATGLVFSIYDIDQQLHVVKAGVNYRFNWGAPVAVRY